MTRLLTILLLLALTVPAFATDSRQGLPDRLWPPFEYEPTRMVEAEVLICLDTDTNPAFADPTPLYAAAFSAAGADLISTCGVDVSGGTIQFPPDLTANNYPIVVVLTSENWWSAPQNIDPADETALANYLDTGGNLLMVGQDYMYGAHPTMGVTSGFPRDYLGLDYVYQDVLYGPNTANISGSVGWMFEGESAVLDSANVFLSNPFFPDCADPVERAGYALYYDDAGQDGAAIYHETETFKTIWCGIELSAADTAEFHGLIEKIYDWFVGTTVVEDASWGHIKSLYRQ